MSTARLAVWLGAALAFVLIISGGALIEEHQEQSQMEACVAAGKQWVRDFGDYYECVEDQ